MKLIILGIQGSGKGTQAKLISEIFNIKHISTGDLLRKEVHDKSELGEEISSYIDKGNLVPDETITKLLRKNLPKDNFLLDGYPRNSEQAKILESIAPIDKIIYLELPEEEVYKRLGQRIQCKKCGAVYGLGRIPLKEGKCDECSEPLVKRKDDEQESIKKRIDLFNKETLPILEFYKSRVIKINGNQSVEDVFSNIKNSLQ